MAYLGVKYIWCWKGATNLQKNGLAMGVSIPGDAEKSGKNIPLLVIMQVRVSQNIGLLDLTNRTQFKKGKG